MQERFREPVAYRGDLAETRRLDPEVLDLEAWLRTTRGGPAGGAGR